MRSASIQPQAAAPKTSEAEIQKEILKALGARDDVRVWRQNTGAARRRGGGPLVRFGLPGQADILGLLVPSGRFLAVEVKTPTGRLSPDQRRWGAAIERAGGLYVVARSVEEAVAAVETAQAGGAR